MLEQHYTTTNYCSEYAFHLKQNSHTLGLYPKTQKVGTTVTDSTGGLKF